MNRLVEMLSVARPGNSESVKKWTEKFIDPYGECGNFFIDEIGNRYIKIGHSNIAFTAHTDTVHSTGGEIIVLHDSVNSRIYAENSILGADDGVGCFLLVEMIKNKVPGTYIFYVEEESGGVGANYSLENHPEYYKDIYAMISMDRRGTGSVITHQGGRLGCTPDFSIRLSDALNKFGHSFVPDDTGIFTDSAVFIGTIPECTNLSVGYFKAHSKDEYVDLNFLEKFTKTIINLDWSSLVLNNNYK